jgi:hypothetical protein
MKRCWNKGNYKLMTTIFAIDYLYSEYHILAEKSS